MNDKNIYNGIDYYSETLYIARKIKICTMRKIWRTSGSIFVGGLIASNILFPQFHFILNIIGSCILSSLNIYASLIIEKGKNYETFINMSDNERKEMISSIYNANRRYIILDELYMLLSRPYPTYRL